MATTVAALQAKLDADTSRFDSAIRRSDSRFGRFGGTVSRGAKLIGAAMVAGGLVAAVGMKKSVDAASDLNESVNAVQVVFGKASKQIFAFGKTAAQSAGLSQRAFNQAVTPIGASLRNVGLSADEAAQSSIDLAQRAADMASVFNVDVSEALTAIQAGLRGEADPLERFGVGLSEAAIQAYAVKTGMADANEELTAGQKVQARLGLLMEQTNRVAGDFANTSDGFANSMRILRSRLEDVAAGIGTILMPALLTVVNFVSDTALPVIENFVKFLQRVFRARTLRAKLNIVWTGVKDTVTDLFDKIKTVLFGGAATPLKLPTGKIIEWDQSSTQGLLDKLASALDLANWTDIGSRLGQGLAEGLKKSAETLGGILDAINSWVDSHSKEIGETGLKIMLSMVNAMSDPAFWKKNWELILSVALTLIPIGRVVKIGAKLAELVAKAFGVRAGVIFLQFVDWLSSVFASGVLRALKKAFTLVAVFTFINGVERLIKGLLSWLQEQWNRIPGMVRSALSGVGAIILRAFIGPLDTVIGKIREAIGWFTQLLGLSSSNVGSGIGAAAGKRPPEGATGGIVRRPTLALIGERGPEAVIPLSRTPGSSALPGNVNVYVGGSVIAERDLHALVRRLNEEHRRRGGS